MVRTSMGGAGADLDEEETTGIPTKVPVIGVYRKVFGALKDRCCETVETKCCGIEGMAKCLLSFSRSPSLTGSGANAAGMGVARGEREVPVALRKPMR